MELQRLMLPGLLCQRVGSNCTRRLEMGVRSWKGLTFFSGFWDLEPVHRVRERRRPRRYLVSAVSEYSWLWWRLSRCDNPAAFSGGTIVARRPGSDESIAPLNAALLVAA